MIKFPKSKTLVNFFHLLDFSDEEINIYLTLIQRNASTILEIARTTGISRTQVYRILETMKTKGAVEEIVEQHRIMAKAVDINELERLIKLKQDSIRTLTSLFPHIKTELEGQVGIGQPETKVQFYRGKAGIMQMVWHTLRARKEVVGFTCRVLQEYIGFEFMTDWRDEFIKKKLVMRDIYSDRYLESKKQANIKINYPQSHFPSRYLPSKIIDINLQTDYYNDVSAIYNWHEGEVFGVEIYNQKITDFNKQIFQLLWNYQPAELPTCGVDKLGNLVLNII